jgi:DivIVA domain-containing protein
MANHQDPATPDPTGATITPADIQRQEFGVSRFGGYRMRDVDEFLDRLTASTEAIIAENERIRAGGAPIVGTSDLDEVNRQADEIVQRARDEAARIVAEANEHAAVLAGGATVVAGTGADRAAVDAFLTRERDFLQSLATLVQGHAEAVKAMARKARSAAPTPPADPAATAPQAPVAVPEAAPAPTHAPTSGPAPTAPVPTTPGEEPVRIDEPQHAAAGDREGDGDPSLRRLFWGEEG